MAYFVEQRRIACAGSCKAVRAWARFSQAFAAAVRHAPHACASYAARMQRIRPTGRKSRLCNCGPGFENVEYGFGT